MSFPFFIIVQIKAVLKYCRNQMLTQQNELENWFWLSDNINKTMVFQLKIHQLVFFHTCDEIVYNFYTPPSIVLSGLFSNRAYGIYNTVQWLTCRAYLITSFFVIRNSNIKLLWKHLIKDTMQAYFCYRHTLL